MATLRHHLRVVTLIWLVFQVAWLTALVPRDCCAAHRSPEMSHHRTGSATQCPMRGADGRPCPMHRGAQNQHAHQTAAAEHHHGGAPAEHDHRAAPVQGDHHAPARTDCRLMGTCDGPMAALFSLLSSHGILPESTTVVPNVESRRIAAAVGADNGERFQPPDPPPPRT